MSEYCPTVGMMDALDAVKEAVSSKDLVAYLTHYYVHDKTITATDGRMVACAPFPDDREYLVPADEFERSLALVGEEGKISVKDTAIWLSGRKRRAKVKTLDPGNFSHLLPPEGREHCPITLLPTLRRLRPFVSDDASKGWSMAILFREGRGYATNNVVVATSDTESDFKDCMIPAWAVDYLLDREQPPAEYSVTDNCLAFHYLDNSWMRTQLPADQPPDLIFELADNIEGTPEPITAEWRDGFEAVAKMSENEIRVHADKLTGGHRHADVEIDISTNVKDEAAFHPKFMGLVLLAATEWDLSKFPDPAPWWGDNIKGLMVGRR